VEKIPPPEEIFYNTYNNKKRNNTNKSLYVEMIQAVTFIGMAQAIRGKKEENIHSGISELKQMCHDLEILFVELNIMQPQMIAYNPKNRQPHIKGSVVFP